MADRPDIKKVIGVGKTQGRTRRMLLAGLAIVLLGLAGWYWIAQSSQGDAQTYLTAEIERGDLTVIVTATGTVQPTKKVDVSSELSGTVRKVLLTIIRWSRSAMCWPSSIPTSSRPRSTAARQLLSQARPGRAGQGHGRGDQGWPTSAKSQLRATQAGSKQDL